MQARAAAVNELVDTGAIDDLTAAPGSDLDAQIAALTAGTQVDAEMAKLTRGGRERHPGAGAGPGRGRRVERARGRGEMTVVRILGSGQFRLDDAEVGHLNELDNAVASAVAAGDGADFERSFGELIA